MDASAAVLQIFRNILTIKQEDNDQLRIIDLQVGSQIHSKVPGNLRTELWLSCLHRKGVGSGYASQYQAMLSKGVTEEAAYDIEKDVGRTFPGFAKFSTVEGKQALERVLRAYAAFDTEVNYCQGMNFLAALLLIWLPREADAFGALVLVMKDRGLRELYKTDMTMLQARLWQLGKIMPRPLARHMEAHCAIPVLYASSWLLTAFASDFPIFFSSRVMDIILADRYLEAMMKVVVGILKACEARLLGMTDMEKMVDFLRGEVPRWPHDKLQELLTEALAAEWTREQAAVLERTEGAESVVDAVQRVASASPLEDEEAEEEAKAAMSPSKKEPKLASFSWASKLAAASSSAGSSAQPNLLQSLTGSISDFGASLPSYFDAARQMTSSGLSPLADLLGLSDSPNTSPEPQASASSRTHGASSAAGEDSKSPVPQHHSGGGRDYAPAEQLGAAGGTVSSGGQQSSSADAKEGTQQGQPEGSPSRGLDVFARRSLGLASSSSWGPFHDSEDAEGTAARGSVAVPAPASNSAAPSCSAADLAWSPPRHCSGSLPTSPFKQLPESEDSGAAWAAVSEGGVPLGKGAREDTGGSVPRRGCELLEGPCSGEPGSGQAAGQPGNGPGHGHRESIVSWGSFREPSQNLGGHESDPAASAVLQHHNIETAGSGDGDQMAGQGKIAGGAAESADHGQQHLGRLDEDGCWNGCLPGGADLISPGDSMEASGAIEDPFSHMTLTQPLSHANMQRGEGVGADKSSKPAVSDWEISQISKFAAAGKSGSKGAPMRKA